MTALAGRIALVTGASRGIGAATAVELARLGAHVVLVARTQGGLDATDDAIRAIGGTATLLPLDLRDGAKLDQVGPSLFERFKRLDILVSNAAIMGRVTPAPHVDMRDWDDAVAINTTAEAICNAPAIAGTAQSPANSRIPPNSAGANA